MVPSVRSMISGRLSSRCLIALVTLLFAGLCAVPYVVAAARQPEGQTFTGLLLNPYDQHYYLASERSAADHLPRSNRFTAENGAPGPVSRLYPLMGLVGAVTGLPAILLYHLPRVLSSIALPLLLMVLMQLAFPGNFRRAFASVVLALFAVGLATLAPGLFSHPLGGDNVPEATILQSVMVFPHFAVAYVGITLGLITIVLALRHDRLLATVAAGVGAGVLLSLSHAFLLLPVALTLGGTAALVGWRCWRTGAPRSPLRRLALAGAAIFAPALPFLLAFRSEMGHFERLQGWPFPSTPSDTPWTWTAGYLFLVPFVLVGLVMLVRQARSHTRSAPAGIDVGAIGVLLLAATIQATLVLAAVTPFQRRFSEGLVIPLAALAGLGLTSVIRREILVIVPIVACAVIGVARTAGMAEYLPDSYGNVFRQIDEQDVVLAGDTLASTVPAYAPGTAFVARTTETLHYAEKHRIRRAFLVDPNSKDALERLRAGGVTLVLVESSDGHFMMPPERLGTDCYREAFRFGTVTGYRLQARCASG